MISGNFDEQRSWVRDQKYTNTKQEREAINIVDGRIFAEVRSHERNLVRQGQKAVADVVGTLTAARRTEAKLDSEIAGPFAKVSWTEEPIDLQAGIRRYNTLRAQTEEALSNLARQEEALRWMQVKLRDPYTDLANLLTKFFSNQGGYAQKQITWRESATLPSATAPAPHPGV